MPEPIVIESDTNLGDVEHHFRVFAGPGAGKTFWLINHIKNVVRNSKRLSSTSYIACISYTNVAVSEIVDRLGPSAEYVDSSTIHSFLYRNVVKPYLHLIKDDSGSPLVDYVSVDGHEEHKPTIGIVREWLESVGSWRYLYSKINEVCRYLKKVKWVKDQIDGNWNLKTITYVPVPEYLPTTRLDSYKAFYWKRGIIDHEDVLYFAYRILEENPLIRIHLSARFPYVFIDEFQDTNPVQTQVVKWLASEGTIVGAIGDVEQSIYSFQGARYQDFLEFDLDSCIDYKIENNRRSTDSIINLLDHVRTDDIRQIGIRQIEGESIIVYGGNIGDVISAIRNRLPENEILTIVARNNDEVNSIRKSKYVESDDLWNKLEEIDSDRSRFLEYVVNTVEMARKGDYSLALKRLIQGLRIKRRNGEIRKPFKMQQGCRIGNVGDIHRRALAVTLLEFLVTDYIRMIGGTTFEAYQKISNRVNRTISWLSLTVIRRGRFQDFAQSTPYSDLVNSVSLSSDETRTIRTIHQAKGTQFKNLLVSFNHKDPGKARTQLGYVLNPTSSAGSEEKRITYVALSRAEDRLFLCLPELSNDEIRQLELLELEVIVL